MLHRYGEAHATYPSDLTLEQALLVRFNLEGALSRLRKYSAEEIINAIAYVLKTGCQWSMLPAHFPKWKTACHHFRSLGDRGWFRGFLRHLVQGRRAALGLPPQPSVCVIDSQSVRSALPQSRKGIDGVFLDCVKSNFGSPVFVPIEGRWVVERTFSWMENYRRLTCNYEKLLTVAANMFMAACVFFMLRYF